MPNDFYNVGGVPATASFGSSAVIRAEYAAIQAGFDKLPTLSGNNSKFISVNAGGTALEAIDDATAQARMNLQIGVDVQAFDATLQSISALGTAADRMIYTTGVNTWAESPITSFGRSLVDDANNTAARTTLGLGTIATQDSNNVTITGGAISVATINNSVIGGSTPAAGTFTTLSATGTVTLGDGPTDAHTINGTATIFDDSQFGLGVKRTGAGDGIWFGGAAAGSGADIHVLNDSGGDFEPLGYRAEYHYFHSRTGVGTTAEIVRITSAGLIFGTDNAYDIGASGATRPRTIYVGTSAILPNTGLKLLDTNASHQLTIAPGSDLTANRTLTLTTGDAARTIDISAASLTLSAFGASLIDDADAAAARTTLGVAGAGPITSSGMTMATARLLGRWTAGTGAIQEVTVGSGLQLTAGGNLEATGAGGSVTSVDVSGGTTGLTTSGGPVITSGTITLAGTLVVANGGTGSTTAGGARTNLGAAAAGANTDITSIILNNTGLRVLDTNATHFLTIQPGSDLTLDRTLTITTGNASRTITLNGDTTLSGTNTGDQTITLTGEVTGSGTGSFAATIASNAVTYAKIQDVTATDRILGRVTAGAGDIEEIVCTAAGRALLDDAAASNQRTTLGLLALATLNSVGTSQIDNDSVTYAKIQNVSVTDRVLGRASAGAGDVEEIACTAAGRALIDDATAGDQRNTLGLGALATLTTVGTTQIVDDAVTFDKFQNINTARVLGRTTGSAGNVEELSAGTGIVFSTGQITVSSNLGTWNGKTAPSGTVVGTSDSQTLTNKTLTSPAIGGGTVTALTLLSVDDTNSAFNLAFASTSGLSADRAITFDVQNGSRTLTIPRSVTLGITLGTQQTLSGLGAAVTFGSIPSGVRRITVMISGMNFATATGQVVLHLGDAGGLETSGYAGVCSTITATVDTQSTSTGFQVINDYNENMSFSGSLILSRQDSSTHRWVLQGALSSFVNILASYVSSGTKDLSAELTQLRLEAIDNFDGGTVNISYEF